jgi:hypothetical protein
MSRRTRAELEVENADLLSRIESIREEIDDLFEDEEPDDDDGEQDDED